MSVTSVNLQMFQMEFSLPQQCTLHAPMHFRSPFYFWNKIINLFVSWRSQWTLCCPFCHQMWRRGLEWCENAGNAVWTGQWVRQLSSCMMWSPKNRRPWEFQQCFSDNPPCPSLQLNSDFQKTTLLIQQIIIFQEITFFFEKKNRY